MEWTHLKCTGKATTNQDTFNSAAKKKQQAHIIYIIINLFDKKGCELYCSTGFTVFVMEKSLEKSLRKNAFTDH